MDFKIFCDRFCQNISIDEYIEDGHNTTFKGTKNGRDVFIKYTDASDRISDFRCEYEVTNILSDCTDISCPTPISKIDKENKGIMTIYSFENLSFPTNPSWSKEKYCKNIIDSATNLFNTFHNNDQFVNKVFNSEFCHRFVSRNYLFKNDIGQVDEIQQLRPYSDKCVKAHNYLESNKNKFPLKFNHNDLKYSQFGFNEGVLPVLDLEHFGLSDPCYDISRFETSFIDEMMTQVRGNNFAAEMRKRFHNNLETDVESLKRYRAYKLLNTMRLAIFVATGNCSPYWLEVGSQERCLELKKEQLEKIEL